MKASTCLAGFIALLLTLNSVAQVPNEGLANGILAARKKDAAMLMEYNWNSRTEIMVNGEVKDIRIDLVNLGADGRPQRTLLNDSPSQIPGGFLRHAIAEKEKKELEKYIHELSHLVGEYTLPSASKVLVFLVQAQVQPATTPDGKTVLLITGNNVVTPGDTFSMNVDGTTLRPMSIQITTLFEGETVTISGSFKTLTAGLNHLQYATVGVPDKGITLMIHNYDYVPNN